MFLLPILQDYLIKEINVSNLRLKQPIDSDYCIISSRKEVITISYFRCINKNKFNICQINFIASSSDLLFDLIVKHDLLFQSISLGHALYIGKEVYKAELSKIFLQLYVQS